MREYPRRDSNPRTWLRRPVLYPLSYGGVLIHQYSKCALVRQGELTPRHVFGEHSWSEVIAVPERACDGLHKGR